MQHKNINIQYQKPENQINKSNVKLSNVQLEKSNR